MPFRDKVVVSSSSDDARPGPSYEPPRKRHKKEKKKKSKRDNSPKEEDLSKTAYLQDPNVNFYEEKSGVKSYSKVPTLSRPACPSYALSQLRISDNSFRDEKTKSKRYYLSSSVKRLNKEAQSSEVVSLDSAGTEEENLQKYLRSNPKDVIEWLKYVKIKDSQGPSSYQREKAKLEIAEKGLRFNPESAELLREYLGILPKVYPTDETLEIIQGLLNKDQNNYQLWNSLIYNKQASMAQCIVPDVLKLYEKCMTTLFSVIKSDEILMSKLYF